MDPLGVAVFLALTGWVIAGLAVWAAAELRAEIDRQRRARDRADYAAHKLDQRVEQLQRERDAALMRLARSQGDREQIVEAALGVAMLGQLDALHSAAPEPGAAGLQADSLCG